MRQDDTYEFIGVWDEQYKRVGFEADIEGRPISRLIRCRDCENYDDNRCYCNVWKAKNQPNDGFCHFAEKRKQ